MNAALGALLVGAACYPSQYWPRSSLGCCCPRPALEISERYGIDGGREAFMAENKTEAPSSASVQTKGTEPPASPLEIAASVPSTGRRAAFRDVIRQLTNEELSNPGAQKLLL